MVGLLRHVVTRPWAGFYIDSLPVAGRDGTLSRRMRRTAAEGRVRAKTGTMRGVRALAGYVNDGASPRFAFAVIFNGYKGPSTPYREIQERFCRILLDAADDAAPIGSR